MKSWILALVGSLVLTLITLVILLAWPIPRQELFIISIVEFFVGFVLIGLLLELLFFRHIKAIYDMLDKMEQDNYSNPNLSINSKLNPLLRINKEFHSYGSRKHDEINRLKELAKFRREFIADISHELKTPLFAAQGFVHTLMDGAVEDKTVRDKFLKNAARSLDGLDMLVEDLLTISQIESGEIKMHIESFDVVALGLKVIDQMEVKAEKKQLRLLLENEEDEKIIVLADYRRINQVLTNLVSNAIRYTNEESDIFLRFLETESDVQCSVIDRGVGIPEEDLGRIFERFYRVDKSRSKGGTGLGLAIVKHIIEGHNSEVQVVSNVGKGSTFCFRLSKGNLNEISSNYE